MEEEKVIVSLTTWSKRIHNLPIVLDSIYAQTYTPDKVVLNLAYNEVIPGDVGAYLKEHNVEIYYTEDTKVYKKFLPTLKRYPEACVINIDDDCVFPETMIEEFMSLHEQYPQYPISGNHEVLDGLQCHCGNASLTKEEYFGEWLNTIDSELMQHCPSSDIVFTYLAVKNGHPYIHTRAEYFTNVMQDHLGKNDGYSNNTIKSNGIENTYLYLVNRFGRCENPMIKYVGDEYIAMMIETIWRNEVMIAVEEKSEQIERKYQSSKAYRLGKLLLSPFRWMKRKK